MLKDITLMFAWGNACESSKTVKVGGLVGGLLGGGCSLTAGKIIKMTVYSLSFETETYK